jgi:hypothetical protein
MLNSLVLLESQLLAIAKWVELIYAWRQPSAQNPMWTMSDDDKANPKAFVAKLAQSLKGNFVRVGPLPLLTPGKGLANVKTKVLVTEERFALLESAIRQIFIDPIESEFESPGVFVTAGNGFGKTPTAALLAQFAIDNGIPLICLVRF